MVTQLLCGAGADKDKAVHEEDTALIMSPSIRAPGGGPTALGAGADKGKAVQ